jgi:hypothetical protein
MVAAPRSTKYAPGNGTKPSAAASGVRGKITPISTTSTVVTASARLGRLRKELPAVRMMKRTSVRVASDSIQVIDLPAQGETVSAPAWRQRRVDEGRHTDRQSGGLAGNQLAIDLLVRPRSVEEHLSIGSQPPI